MSNSPIILDVAQGSEEWHKARATRITASNMHRVLSMSKAYARDIKQARENYIPKAPVYAAPLAWGTENEPRAIAAYELRQNVDVDSVGFVIHPEFYFIGASPDGFVGDEGSTEAKCPYNSENHMATIVLNGMPDKHIPQVQTVLMTTRREWCDFISYDPRQPHPSDLYVERIYADYPYHEYLLEECHLFWNNMVLNDFEDVLDVPDFF